MGFLFWTIDRFEDLNATVRWTVACRQLDGGNTIIFIPPGMKMLTNLASSSTSPDGGYTLISLPTKGRGMQTNLASSSTSPDGGYTIIPLPG